MLPQSVYCFSFSFVFRSFGIGHHLVRAKETILWPRLQRSKTVMVTPRAASTDLDDLREQPFDHGVDDSSKL